MDKQVISFRCLSINSSNIDRFLQFFYLHILWKLTTIGNRRFSNDNKKFELMLTRRAKAYGSSGSVVTRRSTNRARRRVTSFQSKRVTNYATPPTPVPWRHLVNDIDLRSPKSLTPACTGLHEPRGSGLRLLKSTFNAENFIRRLSWSNSSHFVTIQYWNLRSIQILRKIH